jgi:surface antigen
VLAVLACDDREGARRYLYSGSRADRLCRPSQWLAAIAAVLAAISAGGCAYQLDTNFSKNDADVEQTGSIARAGHAAATGNVVTPSEIDLAYARAVAADALARGGKDASIPWENPNTGAGGNITPLATAYNEGASTCRDFLASYVRGQAQAWLQGEACQTGHGKWEVKSLRPLKQG